MNDNQQNIDRIIRDKFENFAPEPPEFIWENIEANLNGKPTAFDAARVKNIIIFTISAIVIILLGWLLLGNKYFTYKRVLTKEIVSSEKTTIPEKKAGVSNTVEIEVLQNKKAETAKTSTKNTTHKIVKNESVAYNIKPVAEKEAKLTNNEKSPFNYTAEKGFELTVNEKNDKFVPTLGALLYSGYKISLSEVPHLITPHNNTVKGSDNAFGNKIPKWKTGVFITPEFAVTSLDSLEVLHSYSLGVDMQYSLSKNTFLRFGIGTTYARDRGLTAIEFKSWDYIGSYDDVYEVTFDTSSGVPVPIYHTQKVDVYDSIQHFDVSETTNRYLYLQFPVMLGYNVKTNNKLNWYVYGGPVINALVYKEKTAPNLDNNSSLLRYNTDLYERNNLIYQFRLGMGFEFYLTDKFSFTLEPDYTYYFNPVFKNYYEKQPLSAVSLRLGFFIKL